jgi:hypothetical protein
MSTGYVTLKCVMIRRSNLTYQLGMSFENCEKLKGSIGACYQDMSFNNMWWYDDQLELVNCLCYLILGNDKTINSSISSGYII